MKFKDRTGSRIGAMTTTSTWERRGKYITWLCKCDCGGERWVASSYYNDEHIVDCGCGIGHRKKGRNKKYIDGDPNLKLKLVLRGMISRCNNKKSNNYHNYGGRGIFVCDEWMESFEKFHSDMGDIPFDGARIDRIDNDDGYYKENCRWVTTHQNNWNQGSQKNSSSKYKGVTKKSSLNKGIRWHSAITRTLNGETIHKTKTFNTEIEAAEWYNEQAKELFGEYAYLNKIDYSEKE